MTPSLLQLHRESGDAHLGQTLVRLAARAAAMHRERHPTHEAGTPDAAFDQPATRPAVSTRNSQALPHGWGSDVHTEVDL